jgi:hypothetical protein
MVKPMSDGHRDLHTESAREWVEEYADVFADVQYQAFLAGFEAAANESESFDLLREWLESERDAALDKARGGDDEDPVMKMRYMTCVDVLVKLSEMGNAPETIAESPAEIRDEVEGETDE